MNAAIMLSIIEEIDLPVNIGKCPENGCSMFLRNSVPAYSTIQYPNSGNHNLNSGGMWINR
jgi:hypothetical protein